MTSTQDEGVYTKTAAYNFLKRLIGIKPKDSLNRQIFNLCFSGSEHVFRPRMKEGKIQDAFRSCKVQDQNKLYWSLKQEGKIEDAKKVFADTLVLLESTLRQAA